jgi:hypothetical protein
MRDLHKVNLHAWNARQFFSGEHASMIECRYRESAAPAANPPAIQTVAELLLEGPSE